MIPWLGLLIGARAAECPDPLAAVDTAQAALQEQRTEDAEQALSQFERALSCAWISRPLLGRFWNARGVQLSQQDDPDGAKRAFAAARRLDPEAFDVGYGPELRELWVRAPASFEMGEFTLFPDPPPGSVRVDGRVVDAPWEAVAGWHLVQVGYGPEPMYGTVRELVARKPTPLELVEVPRPIAPVVAGVSEAEPSRRASRRGPALLIGAGAVALAGGALLGVAAYEQTTGIPKAEDLPALEAAHRRQIGCGAAGWSLVGLSAVGVGAHFVL